MNTYCVTDLAGNTIINSFDARDSDFACWKANELAQQSGVPTQRTVLMLQTSSGEFDQRCGEFDLEGFLNPPTWKELQQIIKQLREEAKETCKANWEYKVFRSRGAFVYGEDADGNGIFGEAESAELPKTAKEYSLFLQDAKDRHPTLQTVWASLGVDAADTVNDLNSGDYQPRAGEAVSVIHRF